MKIRSITCFYNPLAGGAEKTLDALGHLVEKTSAALQLAGYEVQTIRLATPPFPELLPMVTVEDALQLAQPLEQKMQQRGFTFLSLGPALPSSPESYAVLPHLLANTQSTFFSGLMTDPAQGVLLAAVKDCAQVIEKGASITPDGFANLRFAALANVPAGVPFFPAAYHDGEEPAFALAIETADLALSAFSQAATLLDGRINMLNELNQHGEKLAQVCEDLGSQFSVRFRGLDFSLAPYPTQLCSLGSAIENLGPQKIGLSGSVAAAAILADTLDQGSWKRTGFNGLMLPVLEDATLAQRAAEGTLTIRDLLLFSAVCGAGLDTVPLPGDLTSSQIAAILLDVAALAMRLGKPLTARLMPIPGKTAGEITNFDFSYFANGGILDLPASPLQGLLAGDGGVQLHPRPTS